MEQSIKTVDEYIAQFPQERQEILKKIRQVIRSNAPDATEKISWQMPTYWQGENLIHFASHKNHIGIYPSPEAVVAFRDRLKDYKQSKGAFQLPAAQPIPYDLIADITRFRVEAARKG